MKHVPMRMCVQTRKKFPKSELARFAIDPKSSKFVLDHSGKIRSRGANLILDLEVYDSAVKSGVFERALKIKITEDDYIVVRDEFKAYIEKLRFRAGRKKVNFRVKGESINLD